MWHAVRSLQGEVVIVAVVWIKREKYEAGRGICYITIIINVVICKDTNTFRFFFSSRKGEKIEKQQNLTFKKCINCKTRYIYHLFINKY